MDILKGLEMTTKQRSTDPRNVTLIRMQKILDFIKEYRAANQISPTLTEISIGIGWDDRGRGNVHPLIRQLIDEGFLVRAMPTGSRTLLLADPQPAPYYYLTPDQLKDRGIIELA